MLLRRGTNLVPVAFIGVLLLALPSYPVDAADDFEPATGSAEAQDSDSTEPRLVRRNFLRFGKRSDPDQVNWMKRESENGPGEIYENTVVGIHPHRSSPRSFLRFGKRAAASPASYLLRPEQEKSVIALNRDDADADGDEIPYTSDELEAMLAAVKRADNFLRFGKRYLLPENLRDRLALLDDDSAGLKKRSKDFLRFG